MVSATSRTATTKFAKSILALATPESFIPMDLTVSDFYPASLTVGFSSITLRSGLEAHRAQKGNFRVR
jgi:hypothetical protein